MRTSIYFRNFINKRFRKLEEYIKHFNRGKEERKDNIGGVQANKTDAQGFDQISSDRIFQKHLAKELGFLKIYPINPPDAKKKLTYGRLKVLFKDII